MPPVLNYPGTPGTTLYGGLPGADLLAPAVLRLYNWQDPEAPVLVDSLTLDTDIDPLTFQDSRLSAELGSVAIKQSTESIVYGTGGDAFEFGATLFTINGSLNDEAVGEPVYQLLVAGKPHARWSGWPAFDGYNAVTDSTIPKAFKIIVENAAGTVLHTFEMRDGLAINYDPAVQQTRTTTTACRPPFNCGMMLQWTSARIKVSSDLNFWMPALTSDSVQPRDAKPKSTVNPAIPLMLNRQQINGALHWYALPQWPLPYDNVSGSTPELNALDPNTGDPNLFLVTDYTGDDAAAKAWRFSGWDYEPGSISGHDWFPGPGGSRFDRSYIPTALALFADNPAGVRPKNSEPLRDMAEAWCKGYFNHGFHYVTDVKTLGTIPNAQIVARQWSYGYTAYYGAGSSYVAGGSTRHVNPFGIQNASADPFWPTADKDGLRHFNGVQFDDQHNYSAPGWGVLLLNSPMHLYSQKQRFASNTMSWLGAGLGDITNTFGQRTMAWRWLHYAMQWSLGTTHSLGYSRAEVESMFQIELESIHDNLYVPAIVENSSDFRLTSLRNLGIYKSDTLSGGGGNVWVPLSTPLWLYIAGPLQMMKQSGMWAAMKAKNSNCSLALDFVIECLDKWSCDFIVATNGRAEWTELSTAEHSNALSTIVPSGGTPVMPTSWANWASVISPAIGVENWIQNSAGTLVGRYSAQHLRSQYAFIRRDYFADHNPSRANISEACDLYDFFYSDQRARDGAWQYRIPSHGILEAAP